MLIGSVTTPAYDRPSTWDDADWRLAFSDRHEILIAQHRDGDGAYSARLCPSDGCFVQTGRWLDPYDNIYYYAASDVQIDHVVALYESWISGLGNVDASVQRRYANTGSVSAGVLPETSHNFTLRLVRRLMARRAVATRRSGCHEMITTTVHT